MEVAEIFVSARPSCFIDESDNFIPRVDEGPIIIFVEKNILWNKFGLGLGTKSAKLIKPLAVERSLTEATSLK